MSGSSAVIPAPAVITPRLRLRRFDPDDLELLDRLNSDPEVMRYMGNGPMSRTQTEAMLRGRILDYYGQHAGLGIWATLERDTGDCIGMHVLNHIPGEAHIQVGYRLFPRFWGRGYATEMSIALIRYGFVEIGLQRIVAITDPDNGASLRVLEKCGLHRDGERTFPHPALIGCGPQAWFEREAEAWLDEHQGH